MTPQQGERTFTAWGADDYERAAELCEKECGLHDPDGAYADMLRGVSAALTAAAEREAAKDTEIAQLTIECDGRQKVLAEAHATIARLTERVKWFEAAGGINMSLRIHELMSTVARLTAERLKCASCDKEASCIGRYEGTVEFAPACDDCCGHGNEDGECFQLVNENGDYMTVADMLGRLNQSEKALNATESGLQAERQKVQELLATIKRAKGSADRMHNPSIQQGWNAAIDAIAAKADALGLPDAPQPAGEIT